MTTTRPDLRPDDRLPIGEAAKVLGLHRNTITRYIKAGVLKYGLRRHGRHAKFILGREILRFFDAKM